MDCSAPMNSTTENTQDTFQIPNPFHGLSTNTPTDLDVSRQDWEELGEEFKGLGIEEAQALLVKRLGSRRWRLDNLYKVTDEQANVLTFKMRFAQKLLFLAMWYCNIVLKSRQHGITTFMCILLLDTCLFNSNMHTAIIAHNKEDAKDFFTKKIKFAYDNLPNWLKAGFKAKQDAVGVLSFDNGSSIRVTTSGRSGTYQMVHVSEFGKMCAKFPAKAQEVITGTLNTIHPGQIVTIESTAEGREGKFYEMTKDAMNAAKEGRQLSELDFKFHFFGANEKAENRVTIPVPIPTRLSKYFDKIEGKIGKKLSQEFKWWYVSREKTQGEFMYQEHPMTADEAFFQSVEGAYYSQQMSDARKAGRLTKVPHKEGLPVHTFWDLGLNDFNAIWFIQRVGREIHVIDYYENSGEGLIHYADYCRDLRDKNGKPYRYGRWCAPHDITVHEYTTNKTRLKWAAEHGIKFEVGPQVSIHTQIETVRRTIPVCWFDSNRCEQGIDRLDSFRKEWNDKLGCWRDRPLHDDNSHGASAFALMSLMIEGVHNWDTGPMETPDQAKAREIPAKDPTGWT